MHFDGGLTGERCADFLAHARQVRRLLVERRVDELAQKCVDVFLHELRRHRGNGEGVA